MYRKWKLFSGLEGLNKLLSPKFLLEENLIKLAKWLRLMGYDADVYRSVNINALIALAVKEHRIILTRSKRIAKLKQRFSRFLIKSDNYINQLSELKDYISINENHLFSRCMNCNVLLHDIEKKKIKDLVPTKVFHAFYNFKICRRCGRIYWQGSHYIEMYNTIHNLFHN